MNYVTLGRTDLRVSRICFGCAPLSGYDYGPVDDAVSIAALRRAHELGINFFDTADIYGLGRAERVLHLAFGINLSELVIATKVGVTRECDDKTRRNLSPAHIRQAVEASLERLKLETIPLYQIHWPDEKTQWEDCIATLENLRSAGKIRHYGACNLNATQIEICQGIGRLESLQLPFSLVAQEHQNLLRMARIAYGMTTLSYNVLAHGFLAGKYAKDTQFDQTDLRQRAKTSPPPYFNRIFEVLDSIRAIAKKHNRDCAEVAISWTMAQDEVAVALVGTKTAAQIETSARASDWILPASDFAVLSAVSRQHIAPSV